MTLFGYLQAVWLYLTVFSMSGVVTLIIVIFLLDLFKENTYLLSSTRYFNWRTRVKSVLIWFVLVFLVMCIVGMFTVLGYWLIRGF